MIKEVKKNKPYAKGPLIKKGSVKAGDDVQLLILCLLPAVTNLHWLHLNADTYVEHEVLGDLYGCLQEQLDCLAEQHIEHYGKLPSYEGLKYYICLVVVVLLLLSCCCCLVVVVFWWVFLFFGVGVGCIYRQVEL